LWAGGPGANPEYNFGIRKDAYKALPEVRKLLDKGKFNEANRLANKKMTGIIHKKAGDPQFGDFVAQQTMGDLYVNVANGGKPVNYIRELDIENAEGKVSYDADGVHYQRTYFGNYPSKVMVYRYESSKPADYYVRYETPHKKLDEKYDKGIYAFHGEVAENGQEFEMCIKVETDGHVEFNDGKLQVKGAKVLTLYQTSATDYLMKYPEYKGNDFKGQNRKTLAGIDGKSYDLIRN
jgi:alpha-L-fucosidase 2